MRQSSSRKTFDVTRIVLDFSIIGDKSSFNTERVLTPETFNQGYTRAACPPRDTRACSHPDINDHVMITSNTFAHNLHRSILVAENPSIVQRWIASLPCTMVGPHTLEGGTEEELHILQDGTQQELHTLEDGNKEEIDTPEDSIEEELHGLEDRTVVGSHATKL